MTDEAANKGTQTVEAKSFSPNPDEVLTLSTLVSATVDASSHDSIFAYLAEHFEAVMDASQSPTRFITLERLVKALPKHQKALAQLLLGQSFDITFAASGVHSGATIFARMAQLLPSQQEAFANALHTHFSEMVLRHQGRTAKPTSDVVKLADALPDQQAVVFALLAEHFDEIFKSLHSDYMKNRELARIAEKLPLFSDLLKGASTKEKLIDAINAYKTEVATASPVSVTDNKTVTRALMASNLYADCRRCANAESNPCNAQEAQPDTFAAIAAR